MGKIVSVLRQQQAIQGMSLGVLLRTLARNNFRVDSSCLGRLAYLFGVGTLNSVFGAAETLFNGNKIKASIIDHPPLFVIGHWRSGTTHLHNLLALDESFTYPKVFQAMFPRHFVYTQGGRRFFDLVAPSKRPMDNVAFAADVPHEDEFALAADCAISPYMKMLFPVSGDMPYAELDLKLLSEKLQQHWRKSLILFLKKLTLAQDGRIVLKSPPHLARVGILTEMFPEAQFVHIVRNPYAVFVSTLKLWTNTLAESHLQKPDDCLIENLIFSWYTKLFELFERDRGLVPKGSLCEIKFEDLDANPLDTLRNVYDALGLPGFESFAKKVEEYLKTIKNYQKNVHQLDDTVREKVARFCKPVFERYGYPI